MNLEHRILVHYIYIYYYCVFIYIYYYVIYIYIFIYIYIYKLSYVQILTGSTNRDLLTVSVPQLSYQPAKRWNLKVDWPFLVHCLVERHSERGNFSPKKSPGKAAKFDKKLYKNGGEAQDPGNLQREDPQNAP